MTKQEAAKIKKCIDDDTINDDDLCTGCPLVMDCMLYNHEDWERIYSEVNEVLGDKNEKRH